MTDDTLAVTPRAIRDEMIVFLIMAALLAMPFERRVAHPCIGRDRADLVLPGCAIFEAIRREWPTERVRVADRGLREGILISLIDADRSSGRRPQGPRR